MEATASLILVIVPLVGHDSESRMKSKSRRRMTFAIAAVASLFFALLLRTWSDDASSRLPTRSAPAARDPLRFPQEYSIVAFTPAECDPNQSTIPSEPLKSAVPENVLHLHHCPTVDGDHYVTFVIVEPYPAKPTLDSIQDRLKTAGYEPLKYDVLNPSTPSSIVRGWSSFYRQPIGDHVHQWLADFQNATGDQIRLSMQYRTEPGAPPLLMKNLNVHLAESKKKR